MTSSIFIPYSLGVSILVLIDLAFELDVIFPQFYNALTVSILVLMDLAFEFSTSQM